MRLEHKVVVVTGSTRGIGRAVVEACAEEGAAVVVTSRTESGVLEAVDFLKARGLRVSGRAADVSRAEDLNGLLLHAVQTWGRVDVWVNNAGLSGGYRPLDEMSASDAQEVVDTNLLGTIQACRLLIPYFVARKSGILINLSGRGGRGEPTPFTAVYGATKIAIRSLTLSIARENRDHPISIHAVMPGMVDTDLLKDEGTSPRLRDTMKGMPYVMKAVGVPVDEVVRLFVDIAAQEPGKETGHIYSLLKGKRMMTAMGKLAWYRATGKIKGG